MIFFLVSSRYDIQHDISGKRSTPSPIPNGGISTNVRLACTPHYYSGASPYDLMFMCDAFHPEVMRSVWIMIDNINSQEEFDFQYPAYENAQETIVKQFSSRNADFKNYAGCIDGILIWIQKPSAKEVNKANI